MQRHPPVVTGRGRVPAPDHLAGAGPPVQHREGLPRDRKATALEHARSATTAKKPGLLNRQRPAIAGAAISVGIVAGCVAFGGSSRMRV